MVVHILVDNWERGLFFRRLAVGFRDSGYEVVLYTLRPSVYFYLLSQGLKVLLLTSSREMRGMCAPACSDRSKDIHVLNGRCSEKHAERVYSLTYFSLKNENLIKSCDLVVIFNGAQSAAKAFSQLAIEVSAKQLFMEISNLPGKMFADPLGVNGKSKLASNPKVLQDFKVKLDTEIHERWVIEYEGYKSGGIPQSKLKLHNSIFIAFDSFLRLFSARIISDEDTSLVEKLDFLLSRLKSGDALSDIDGKKVDGDFVFFPTQVSTDTQVLLNSNVGNFEAIQLAKKIADSYGCKLVVKVHPAEVDVDVVSRYRDLAKDGYIELTSSNTQELIKSSKAVCTINSTVGLEALIYGKKIHMFGRSAYSDSWGVEELFGFIHGYLVDIDYFSNSKVSEESVKHLLALAGLSQVV